MTMRRPAEVFPPGDILKEELEARGWSQTEFAEILDRPPGAISDLLAGKRPITPETARRIGAALETSPELWMNLDAAYRLSRLSNDNDDRAVGRRARLYDKVPIKDMIRRGWIESSESIDVLESRVLRFLGTESIDDEPDLPLHAARKSTPYAHPMTPAQQVWLIRVSQLARAVHAKPYSEQSFTDAIASLRSLLHVPQEVRRVPRILGDAGIRFVVVQPLPGNKIDGACLWVDGQPVIAMSLRFDRLDSFWFVLFHELEHVRKGEASFDVELDQQMDDVDKPKSERDADAFAVENLVPQHQLDSFIARVRPLYSARRIEAFARTMHVHPAIVVGQLQHRGEITYSNFRKTLAPVRDWITVSALTDGWGTELPAQL